MVRSLMQGRIKIVVCKVSTDLLRIPSSLRSLLLLLPQCTFLPLLDGGLYQTLIESELVEDPLLMIHLLAHYIPAQLLLQLTELADLAEVKVGFLIEYLDLLGILPFSKLRYLGDRASHGNLRPKLRGLTWRCDCRPECSLR